MLFDASLMITRPPYFDTADGFAEAASDGHTRLPAALSTSAISGDSPRGRARCATMRLPATDASAPVLPAPPRHAEGDTPVCRLFDYYFPSRCRICCPPAIIMGFARSMTLLYSADGSYAFAAMPMAAEVRVSLASCAAPGRRMTRSAHSRQGADCRRVISSAPRAAAPARRCAK